MSTEIIVKQFYLGCLAHASYLIGDAETQTAAVIDPQRDVEQYVEYARRHGLKIRHVLLTHFHADFLAGHLELRDREGARIYLSARGAAEYAFTPLKEGDRLEFGQVRLQALETPGHTPESISILLYDLSRETEKPCAVFTGDTLFVGDVGRPDLRVALGWAAADLGRLLYHSLREKLLSLPDETLVYPAHGAGSMCGKNLGNETVSTIGAQRQNNYVLRQMNEDEFLSLVLADQPEAPPYFTYDAVLNTKERPTLEETLPQSLKSLTLEEALRLGNAGAQLLDVRDPAEFESAHLADSINIGLGGKYATWAGTILDREKPIVIIASPGQEQEAAVRLGRIGFDHIAGCLGGGMGALTSRPDLVRQIDRITPPELAEQLRTADPPLVLDVRAEAEWREARIGESLLIPLPHLAERIGEIPRGRRLVVHCAGGYRSAIGASILRRHGITDLATLAGGITAWEASHLPSVRPGAGKQGAEMASAK